MNNPYDPDSISKLVHEYLVAFHSHYKLPRHFDDSEMVQWCADNLGTMYRDWSYHKGHSKDPYSVLHIKDSKWCTMFELRWGHLVVGTLDIK